MRVRATLRGLGILVLEGGALVILHRGDLPSVGWSDVGAWLDATPPEDAILAIVRVVALAGTWYLVATTLLVMLASVTKIPALVRGVRIVALPGLRRAIEGVAAVSIATAPLVTATPAFASTPAPSEMPMELPAYSPTPAGDTDAYEPTPASDMAERSDRIHVVLNGESLWSIAEDAIPDETPDRATVVDAYWRVLLELNAGTLRSGDPNLIYPGEVIRLPGTS